MRSSSTGPRRNPSRSRGATRDGVSGDAEGSIPLSRVRWRRRQVRFEGRKRPARAYPRRPGDEDIDFATSSRESAETVLRMLNALAARDLGDFCSFRLADSEESLDENGYSRLLKLRYASFIGDEEKDPILIDLSLDCSTTLPPELVSPANRVRIEGVETCDYLAYPLPDQLADKLCAIMELQPGGWPSSRMKDLVDVVTYATHEGFSLRQLATAIESECGKRGMAVPKRFEAPSIWRTRFAGFAETKRRFSRFATFDAAVKLAAGFFDPALSKSAAGDAEWSYTDLRWNADIVE
ncbi:MAG: nucleotidyl transferase AbiEii/AbiGii toxin family protein [Gordonibacter pamelaeae]